MYFIFVLIDLFSLPPIACAKYAYYVVTVRETHREDAFSNRAKTVVPYFNGTVGMVFRDNATRICKGELCF